MLNSGEIIKTVTSPINDKLNIVLQGDKKLLNTANTNYSYGTLVDVLEYGLDSIPLNGTQSVLLLGMGAGSIIQSLRKKYDCHAPVVAVELDPVVVDLAHDEFEIGKMENVEIHCADAWDFVKKCEKKFDLIIIDIYIDLTVPEKFYNLKFWEELERITNEGGFVLFNAGIDKNEDEMEDFAESLPDSYISQTNYNVLSSNTVIISQKM